MTFVEPLAQPVTQWQPSDHRRKAYQADPCPVTGGVGLWGRFVGKGAAVRHGRVTAAPQCARGLPGVSPGTDRGTEAGLWSYGLMDLTVFGRQEAWENSPAGWPRIPECQHQWRVEGRPTAQWAGTDEPAATPATTIDAAK